MGIKMFKEKIQKALGSNNRQSQGNKAKAKNGAKIYQNAGDVIEGIQSEELEGWFAELRAQIKIDNKKAQNSIEKSIESVLVYKIAKIVVETYKEHCESCSPDEKLVLLLDQIKSKADNVTNDIQKVITDFQDTKNAAGVIKSKLDESRKQVEAEIESISRICEDILYWSHRTHALCEKLFEKITITENGQEKLTTLFTQYINAAELRHKEVLAAIEKSSGTNQNHGDNTPSYLDMSTLAEMFAVINEINEMQKDAEGVDDLIEHSVTEVNDRCKQIQRDINEIRNDTSEGIKKANEILGQLRSLFDLSEDTNTTVHAIKNDTSIINAHLEELLQATNERDQYALTIKDDGLLGEELSETQTKLNESEQKLATIRTELFKRESNGAKSLSPCPYCGAKESDRYVINDGHCECSVCGHRYVDINPDMSDISDEKIKKDISKYLLEHFEELEKKRDYDTDKGQKWKELHTAKLERVSGNLREDLYRMKLDKYTVSSNGILIIPNETHDGNKVTLIAFCQPNTYDEASKERFNEVKTIILSDNVELSTYEGKYPFENIKVLRWNTDQQIDLTSGPTEEAS